MVSLLDVLPEHVLYWMVNRGRERRVEHDAVLLREGERNGSLFIVLDGLFGVFTESSGDRRHEHLAPGSLTGEISYFTDGVATATVRAEEPSLVLELPADVLEDKLEHDHVYASDFYRALLTTVSQRLRQTSLRLEAAERGRTAEETHDPLVRRTREQIDQFKQTMVRLDKEGIKNGAVTEKSYEEFRARAFALMHACHDALGTGSSLSDHLKAQVGAQIQHEILPYILTTETADRFYSKPRGYAGDYLAIHSIYQNKPGGTGRLGPVVDRMFLETPPALAVRNRRSLIAGEIATTVRDSADMPVRVMCMASGPATEVFDAFALLDEKNRLKVTLMDIDLQALAFVDEIRGKQKLTNQMTLVNENLIALYLGRGKTRLEPQHLVYSIGLVDYLNDKLVSKLLQYVYDHLLPGGRVILGNFHPNNVAKEFMDYVLEWNLIHRTEDDMNRLFLNSPFQRATTRIRFESEGINIFAECRKE